MIETKYLRVGDKVGNADNRALYATGVKLPAGPERAIKRGDNPTRFEGMFDKFIDPDTQYRERVIEPVENDDFNFALEHDIDPMALPEHKDPMPLFMLTETVFPNDLEAADGLRREIKDAHRGPVFAPEVFTDATVEATLVPNPSSPMQVGVETKTGLQLGLRYQFSARHIGDTASDKTRARAMVEINPQERLAKARQRYEDLFERHCLPELISNLPARMRAGGLPVDTKELVAKVQQPKGANPEADKERQKILGIFAGIYMDDVLKVPSLPFDPKELLPKDAERMVEETLKKYSQMGIPAEKIQKAKQDAELIASRAHYLIDNARAYRYEVAWAIVDEKLRKAEHAAKVKAAAAK